MLLNTYATSVCTMSAVSLLMPNLPKAVSAAQVDRESPLRELQLTAKAKLPFKATVATQQQVYLTQVRRCSEHMFTASSAAMLATCRSLAAC